MKPTAALAILALSMACSGQAPAPAAQSPRSAVAQALSEARQAQAAAVAVEKPRLNREEITKIEIGFESMLHNLADPPDVLGACSGVYLSGYGVVFSTSINLVKPPRLSAFEGVPSPVSVHKRKLAQLPVVEKTMRDMLTAAAKGLATLPPGEKLAMAVRLLSLPGEDKTGLPDQIVMSADRAAALAGNIQMELQ